MRTILKGLLMLIVCFASAVAVNVWPYQNFIAAGGPDVFLSGQLSAFLQNPPKNPPEELVRAGLILLCSALAGLCLFFTGFAWSFLRHWKPFATAFATTLVVNAALLTVGQLKMGPDWLPLLVFIAAPAGLSWMIFGFFKGITGSPIIRTFFRLILATLVSAVITVLFPFIVLAGALYLKLSGRAKFTDTIEGAPSLYEFLIMNIYPVFFSILPELLSVQEKGRLEKKQWKKGRGPDLRSSIELDRLNVGDVILTGVDSWSVAAPIQASNILSSSEAERHWCHAAIYKGNGEVIEAQSDGRGVTVTNLADYFFARGSRLRVFRHRFLTEAELKEVVDYCQRKVDEKCPYDTWGVSFYALTALMPPMLSGWLEGEFAEKVFNVKGSYFCSELVAEAFQQCRHDIFKRLPWRVKPLDFAYTPMLEEIDCDFKQWDIRKAA